MEWKDVVGYEGIYEVSDTGLIRSHEDKTTFTKKHGKRKWQQRILKDKTPKGRDSRVSLWKNGESKDFLVHRLVASAFIPKIEGKESINHIDGNPKNNHVSNLEWCDHTGNNNHAFDNHLMTSNDKVILMDKKTEEAIYFRSKAKASEFLGKNKGYLSGRIMSGRYELDRYWVFVNPGLTSKQPKKIRRLNDLF